MRSGLDEGARSNERVASATELAQIRCECKGYLVPFYQFKNWTYLCHIWTIAGLARLGVPSAVR